MYTKNLKKAVVLSILFLFVVLLASCASTATPAKPNVEKEPEVAVKTELPNLPATEKPIEKAKPTEKPATKTWKKIYAVPKNTNAHSLIMAEDGGYYVVGATNLEFDADMAADLYLIKVDEDGKQVWESVYGEGGYWAGMGATTLGNGEVLVSGVKSLGADGSLDIFITQLDQDRKQSWTLTFGGPLDEFGVALPMEDGGYLAGGNIVDPNDPVVDNPGVAGYGGFAGRSNIYLARFNAEGEELWSQKYGGDENVIACGALLTSDGGYLILSSTLYFPEGGDDISLLKLDANGERVWLQTWEKGSMTASDLIQTSDGNFLIVGSYSPEADPLSSQRDFLVIKVDPDGNEIWSTIYGQKEMIDFGKLLIETKDGAYLAAGVQTKDLFGSPDELSLVKLDVDGAILWQKTITMGVHIMFGEMVPHPDGGFVIAGSIANRGQFDIFLIKADAEGYFEGGLGDE